MKQNRQNVKVIGNVYCKTPQISLQRSEISAICVIVNRDTSCYNACIIVYKYYAAVQN